MEAYRDRIALRIREEAAKRGENPLDLAHALRAHPTTVERWFRGVRTPQQRYRVQLAEHWGIPFEDLEPDLLADERELREQLDRIEGMLKVALTVLRANASAGSASKEVADGLRASIDDVLPRADEQDRRERREPGIAQEDH